MTKSEIDAERLWESLETLGAIGAYDDERSGLKGVCRVALTDADQAGRDQVRAWFEAAGLEVRVDAIGNCYGRRAGREDLAPVVSGSHIDSVPTGGRFDGSLGVLSALEVIRSLNDDGVTTRRPIEVAFFTDEEGCRFGTDMLGSAVATGRITLEDAYALTDNDGKVLGEELSRIGWRGDAPVLGAPPHAYVEVHVEQGPVLEHSGSALGLVTGVQAISWQEINVVGKSAHAGTTPMALRKDAGLFVARLNVFLHELVASIEGLRVTMGRIAPHPNLVNIVPSRCTCTVDLRNPDDARMAEAEAAVRAFVEKTAAEMGVEVHARQTAKTAFVPFDDEVQALIARHLDDDAPRLISGAGHDAQEFARVCKTGMIFVRGLHDGISHNPRELSTQEDVARAAEVHRATLLALAEEA